MKITKIVNDDYIIDWNLGNVCNFNCKYCPEDLHNGTKPFPDIKVIEHFLRKLPNDKNIIINFTGGEVTLYKDFYKLLEITQELEIGISFLTNCSRSIRWWETMPKVNNIKGITCTFHKDANKENFVNNIKYLKNYYVVIVNMALDVDSFDEMRDFAEELKNDFIVHPKVLTIDFKGESYPYSEEQRDWIDNFKTIKEKYYISLYTDQKVCNLREHIGSIISNKDNRFTGWICNAGISALSIDSYGDIYRATCKIEGVIGNIYNEYSLPTKPIICTNKYCKCIFDIGITKHENI